MKNFIVFSIILIFTMLKMQAGGLVTNTNHSASFTRLQNRNASTGIDAVYFNPAGLTKLGNGFFVSLNNQTISQTKTVLTDYGNLNGTPRTYIGDVRAPLYPGVYAVYNEGNFSLSAGFNPIGGGGGAKYKTGLPSFEMPISTLPLGLTGSGIPTSKYSANIYFEGTSVYFGYQFNVAYKLNEQLSVGAGIRIVSAKNTYKGHIKDIMINPNQPAFGNEYNGSNMVSAPNFFLNGSIAFSRLSSKSYDLSTALALAMADGLPGETPITDLSAEQQSQIATLFGAAGIDGTGMNVGTARTTLYTLNVQFNDKGNTMAYYKNSTTDKDADVEERGSGFTPILSINYSPSDKFNFSLRYEFKTNLILKTKVFDGKSAGGMFYDGNYTVADMPALLAVGAEVIPIDRLAIAATFNTFFDKKVDYSGGYNVDMIKRNYLEYGIGIEYGITEKFRLSAGWLGTNTGILPEYQNDQRFSSNSNSFGFGADYRISPMIDINIGGQYSINADYEKNPPVFGAPQYSHTETYSKKTTIFAIGLDFYFGKK